VYQVLLKGQDREQTGNGVVFLGKSFNQVQSTISGRWQIN